MQRSDRILLGVIATIILLFCILYGQAIGRFLTTR